MNKPEFIGIEIEACVEDEGGVIPKQATYDAEFWGVYGRMPEDEHGFARAEHIEDFGTFESARLFVARNYPDMPVTEPDFGD